MKKSLIVVLMSAGTVLMSQAPPPRDWIDPETGHRVVRISGEVGGSTLYFHDNAFSPEGDKMMFNTPSGIGVIEVAKIGGAASNPRSSRRAFEVDISRGDRARSITPARTAP